MPWEIRKDLHLDINAAYGAVLLTSGTDSSLISPLPDIVAGDKMPVRLHFWERGPTGTLTAADPGADTSLIFTGRQNNIPPNTALLFQATAFTEISAGVWEGELNLSTQELNDHLEAAPAGAKTITAEVEVRDATGNTKRLSLQFPLTARPQAYDNQDAPTLLPGPVDWLAAQKTVLLSTLGIPTYGDQATANAAENIGVIYYDSTLETLNTVTA